MVPVNGFVAVRFILEGGVPFVIPMTVGHARDIIHKFRSGSLDKVIHGEAIAGVCGAWSIRSSLIMIIDTSDPQVVAKAQQQAAQQSQPQMSGWPGVGGV